MADRNWSEAYTGHLQKRGDKGPVRRWRRRWFSLINNALYYFKEENTKEPLGKIDLYTAISIHPSSPDPEGTYFQIDAPGRIYFLLADSKDQAQRWIDILNLSKRIHGEAERRFSAEPNPPPLDFQNSDNSDMETSSVSSVTSAENLVVGYPEIVHYQSFAQQHTQYQPPSIHGDFYKYPFVNFTENSLKEYYFTEGLGLRQYIDQYGHCCKVVLGSSMLLSDLEDKKKLLCIYLALRTLDWDNNDRFAAFSAKGYEGEVFYMLFSLALSLVQKRILATWPLDAPTIITKIDTWVKRKKSLQQILFQYGDKESIIKWNLALLYVVKQQFLTSSSPFIELEHSITGLMNALYYELNLLPSSVFCNQVWNSINTITIPDADKAHVKALLEASLVMQKLKLDNDLYGFFKNDPLLSNKFETILCEFPQAKAKSPLYPHTQALRSAEMRVFGQWTASLLEHNPNKPQSAFVVFLKNQRILKRLAVKVNKNFYPKLQDDLLLCAIAIEERTPVVEQTDSTVPFPEPETGDQILIELVNNLHL